MNDIIDKIYKGLEREDELWKVLESSDKYDEANQELQDINAQIKTILEEKLGKEGRTLIFDQEQLYYQLLAISQKFFFEQGFKMGAKFEKDN